MKQDAYFSHIYIYEHYKNFLNVAEVIQITSPNNNAEGTKMIFG